MNDQNQSGKVPSSKRRGRGCLLWLGASLVSITGPNAGGVHLRTSGRSL